MTSRFDDQQPVDQRIDSAFWANVPLAELAKEQGSSHASIRRNSPRTGRRKNPLTISWHSSAQYGGHEDRALRQRKLLG